MNDGVAAVDTDCPEPGVAGGARVYLLDGDVDLQSVGIDADVLAEVVVAVAVVAEATGRGDRVVRLVEERPCTVVEVPGVASSLPL